MIVLLLSTVVYHHGEKSTGGHYTTDVFHIGLSSWLRMDDQSIKQVKNNDVSVIKYFEIDSFNLLLSCHLPLSDHPLGRRKVTSGN